eukprot:TRINITY_DN357_c0_g1_i1.p1 TRINITY_DN357_c0_g1~~TRINITY_DN357_c0_g1_i1.p1  ORF type:complete len:3611 (-),score=673.24 TRINITY_DN357_c0_g1_i1:72-10904(-)
MKGRLLYVLLLCLSLIAICCATPTHICSWDSRPESLPNTFNTYSFLGFNEEFHSHGEYYVNFKSQYQNIYFNLTQETETRIYVAPHKTWDIDLWLYSEASPNPIQHSSLLIFTDEQIVVTLPPGSYRYHLLFISYSDEETYTTQREQLCETLVAEFSMVPTQRLRTRVVSQPQQSNVDQIPSDITVYNLNQYNLDLYETNYTYVIASRNNNVSVPFSASVDFFKKISIQVPVTGSSSKIWDFEATLLSDFLVAGSLGLMLDTSNTTETATNITCAHYSFGQSGEPTCILSSKTQVNTNKIRATLPGRVEPYHLYLFDLWAVENNLTRTFEFQFSIDLSAVNSTEDLLTCNAQRIPETLNIPEYLGNRGFLNYREQVFLDYANDPHLVGFMLEATSYVHFYVAEHRIDIDLALLDSQSKVIYSSTRFDGQEESIIAKLQPGRYSLKISYFGTYDITFCETFDLMMGITPTYYLNDFCAAHPPSMNGSGHDNIAFSNAQYPDLSPLATMGTSSDKYSYPNTRFVYFMNGTWEQRTILNQTVTITTPSVLRVEAFVNSIVGDLELRITSPKTGEVQLAEHHRDRLDLRIDLERGSYLLEVRTPVTQPSRVSEISSEMPKCIVYGFMLDLEPISSRSLLHKCGEYLPLTQTLSSVLALGVSNTIHIQNLFLIPDKVKNYFITSEYSAFTVSTPSQFRIYSEPHQVDVDFHLYEGEEAVVSSMKDREEEELAYTLKPGLNYTLKVVYFGGTTYHFTDTCMAFNAEIAIAPIDTRVNYTNHNLALPPTDLLANKNGRVSISAEYGFTQGNSTLLLNLPFNLTREQFFTAHIGFDFLWSNLNMKLLTLVQGEPSLLSFGSTGYNRNTLSTLTLPVGEYILQIYEPSANEDPAAKSFIEFHLDILMESTQLTLNESSGYYSGCGYNDYLPLSLDTLGHLRNPLSDGLVQFKQNALVDTSQPRVQRQMSFTLNRPSLVRIFVAYTEEVDVDFVVSGNGSTISSKNGVEEESVALSLAPGQYNVLFKFWPQGDRSLAQGGSCLSYPVEIGIAPIERVTKSQNATDCTNSLPTSIRPGAVSPLTNYTFAHKSDFSTDIRFNLSEPATLELQVRSEFISSGLTFKIRGSEHPQNSINDAVAVTHYAKLGYNQVYISTVLPAGAYLFTLFDPSSFNVPNAACGQFQMSYSLLSLRGSNNTQNPSSSSSDGGSVSPPEYCTPQTWPVDLYTTIGGSIPYGGPQNAHDSIDFFADQLPIPTVYNDHKYIRFRATQPSLLRFFSRTNPSGNDLDFYIYSDVNKSSGSLIGFSNSFGSDESNLISLPGQSKDYLMDVVIFEYDAQSDCNTASLQIGIRRVSEVRDRLLCPTNMPAQATPPTSLSLSGIVHSNGDYVFTREAIAQNTVDGFFLYNITLTAERNATFTSTIRYDYLTADFQLVLFGKDGELTLGQAGVEEDSNLNSANNFHSKIEAALDPGTYTLQIRQEIKKVAAIINDTECVSFSFTLDGSSSSNPHVVSVNPPSEEDHDYKSALRINIEFSDPVDRGAVGQSLLSYINSKNLIALYTTSTEGDTVIIQPEITYWDFSRNNLMVIFAATGRTAANHTYTFTPGKDYILRFDLSSLTAGNVSFSDAVRGNFKYTMQECDCNGGTCVQVGTEFVCNCTFPYAGPHCKDCVAGYHPAAGECIQNIRCNQSSCNGHGWCSDTSGYPVCVCNTGYASQGGNYCSICAPGYYGYPNCTVLPPNAEEQVECSATIFPKNLNSAGYLGLATNNVPMHLHDRFYVDLTKGYTESNFALSTASVFRLYVSPHYVDVDVYLFKIQGTRKVSIANGGLSSGGEEIVFRVLEPSAVGEVYQIKLVFYPYLADKASTCESFGMDLSIVPLNSTKQTIKKWSGICSRDSNSVGVYPSFPRNRNETSFAGSPAVHISSDYVFNSAGTTYYATAMDKQTISWLGGRALYRWNITFAISNVSSTQSAVLSAELGYRFSVGQLSLALEPGKPTQPCSGGSTSCSVGYNLYNKNVLNLVLTQGTYTLYIYEPISQNKNLTNCVPFDFSFQVRYIDANGDTFACKGARFPRSLNIPGYLNDKGYLHMQDDFILEDGFNNVFFNITEASYFKISAASVDGLTLGYSATLNTIGDDGRATLYTYTYSGQIFERIPAGNYELRVSIFDQFVEGYCDPLAVELLIQPVSGVSVSDYNSYCMPHQTILPHLPENGADVIIPLHHVFPSSQAPYQTVADSGVIQSWSFITTEPTHIRALLTSDYLLGDLRLELLSGSTGSSHWVHGDHRYNMIEIDEDLPIGTYTLQISKPEVPSAIANELATNCTLFEFSLSLDVDSEQNRTAYEKCEGDEIPTTLDTLRFLNTNNVLNYQSSNFKIPEQRFTSRKISFMVSEPSYFRAYIEPHEVDIDIKLFKNPAVGDPEEVATSLNGIGTEEALVYLVKPDVSYFIQLYFWTWHPEQVEECPVFSMQIGLLPEATPNIQNCPNGAEHWPALPNAFSSALWRYDSEHPGDDSDADVAPEKLYIQQQLNVARSKSYQFIIATPMDVYFEAGFDFVLTDLSMSLTHKESGAVYSGEAGFNTNTLTAMNLNPGHYTLKIYEPVATQQSLAGCGYFTFFAEVRRSDTETSEYGINLSPEVAIIPAHLNSVGYLKYSDDIHIQHNFLMFEPAVNRRTVTFTPRVRSYLRVSTQRNKDSTHDIDITLLRSGASIESSTNHLVQIVEANTNYTIQFDRGALLADSLVYYPVEFAIMAIEDANTIANQLAGVCTSNTVAGIPNNNIAVADAPQNVYLYNNNFIYLTSNATSTFIINLNIPKKSVVFVQLGYQFLFNDLDISIHSASFFSFFGWPTLGTHSRNLDTLNTVLYPGSYVMTVTQAKPLPNFNKCTPLSLIISVVPTTEGIINADCTALDPLPSNLNDNRTAIYGGPINEFGEAHIYGDTFLVTQHNEIRFTLVQESGISVFLTKSSGTNAGFSFTLTEVDSGGSIIEPKPLYRGWDEIAGVFNVSPYGTSTYALTITTDAKDKCPSIGLEITIKPTYRIEDSLVCDYEKDHTIPRDLYPDDKGLISNYIEGSFNSSMLTQNGINASYSYGIKFTVKASSDLIASIAFDSLSSYFDLVLVSNTSNHLSTSTFGLYPFESDKVNLVRKIQTYLLAGNYTLYIIRPPGALPYFNDPLLDTTECYPFIFSFDLVPIHTPVVIVNPSLLEYVEINTDFTLRITFNYYPVRQNQTWSLSDPSDLIQQSFYLQNTNNNNLKLYPIAVKNLGSYSYDLVFNHTGLISNGGTFRLVLVPKQLYNYAHNEFYLTSAHQYTFPSPNNACNNHGIYQFGYCRCFTGYAGSQCQICDEARGYKPSNGTSYDKPQTLICTYKSNPHQSNTTTSICKPDSCGCEAKTSGANCRPLGTCYVSDNKPKCHCKSQYSGDHCETCAPGFSNYPYCTASICNPACVHGKCNTTSGQCICEPNWNGSAACDKCAPGYEGSNCDPIIQEGGEGGRTVVWIILGLLLFVVCGIGGFVGWVRWQRWQRSGKYYPLGLRDLKGGMELKAKSSRVGGGDDTSVGAELYEIGEELEEGRRGKEKESVQVRTVEEEDFNPRAGEVGEKKEESKGTSNGSSTSPSSLLDDL